MAIDDTKEITTPKEAGRPTKYCDEVVKKIESIYQLGGTVEEALSYAQISKPTYYEWLERYPDFLTKVESAQHYADIAAKRVVVKAIMNEDLNTAKWWLEKREFKDKPTTAVQVNIANLIDEQRKKYGL